jgi:GMP reductase
MDEYLDFSDVLIKPRPSTLNSRKDVDLFREFRFKFSERSLNCIPIISSNMYASGSDEMVRALVKKGMLGSFHKFVNPALVKYTNETKDWRVFTVGSDMEAFKKLEFAFGNSWSGRLIIDFANGYIDNFIECCELARDMFPYATIIAGNIATPDMVIPLYHAKVDVIKVGLGSGAHCLTRSVTGVGVPQLSAILNIARMAHSMGMYVMSDGGIQELGDIAKAFVAGADFVMIGSMLAGFDESNGEIITDADDQKFKECYGMASRRAQEAHYEAVQPYRASEGRVTHVPYKGPVEPFLTEMLNALRSTCTYTDTHNISDLSKAELIRVNRTLNRSYEKFSV